MKSINLKHLCIGVYSANRCIYFGDFIVKRLTNYLMNNGFIDPSVRKIDIPGFNHCPHHVRMIWSASKLVKQSNHQTLKFARR